MTRAPLAQVTRPQELPALANHADEALPAAYGPRLVHMSAALVPGADVFITSRSVTRLDAPAEPNVHPHRHPVSQTYLLLSADDSLQVEVEIGGRKAVVNAPASIFVPAGELHTIRVLRGSGNLLSVVRSGVYE
ncbi:MAG: hypothetical protein V4609_13795 [Pseudomonadota bacterium]